MRQVGTERALHAVVCLSKRTRSCRSDGERRRASVASGRAKLHVLSAIAVLLFALAESNCGTTQSGTSPVSVSSNGGATVTISPSAADVPTSGAQIFSASLSEGSAGASFAWSVNGIAGGNSTLGSITASGAATAVYTAPAAVPSPASVTVTATNASNSAESGSSAVTVVCTTGNSILPSSANVALSSTQPFTASFCAGAADTVSWDVNGVAGGNSSLGTITSAGADSAIYTAPADLPASSAGPIAVEATESSGAGSVVAVASATVRLISTVSVSVAPLTVALAPNQRATFTPSVTNTLDTRVTWSVDGAANGNVSLGEICVHSSNPCAMPAGPSSAAIDYLAPLAVPLTNPVTIVATSVADPSRSGTATSVFPGVGVQVAPFYAFVPSPGGTQQFFASVSGSTNAAVLWSISSAVSGQGCAGTSCGSIDGAGLYTAPAVAPSPNAISVIATSQADASKSAAATLALLGGPTIEALLPSSAMAGAPESFPFEIEGVNFVVGSGSAASAILVNGAARSTTCSSATTCTTVLNPQDMQSPGTLIVQVQNPGTPATLSNPVPFVIVPFDVSSVAISLTSGQPEATNENIVVTEPTTAAASAPIDVDFIGLLTGGNTCGIQDSPVTITRPVSGTETVSLCIHGSGLDPTFTFGFTGPSGAPGGSDIGVTASAINGLFPNMIELDLQISSATLPGVRTLFITTLNNDRASATGMLEVE
jgi:hypothetical protein